MPRVHTLISNPYTVTFPELALTRVKHAQIGRLNPHFLQTITDHQAVSPTPFSPGRQKPLYPKKKKKIKNPKRKKKEIYITQILEDQSTIPKLRVDEPSMELQNTVKDALNALYHHPDDAVRMQADRWLQDFQRTLDAWQVLHNSLSAYQIQQFRLVLDACGFGLCGQLCVWLICVRFVRFSWWILVLFYCFTDQVGFEKFTGVFWICFWKSIRVRFECVSFRVHFWNLSSGSPHFFLWIYILRVCVVCFCCMLGKETNVSSVWLLRKCGEMDKFEL